MANKPVPIDISSTSLKTGLLCHQCSLNHSYLSSKEIKREPMNSLERSKVCVF